MPKVLLGAGIFLLVCPAFEGIAQHSGTTRLVLQVQPEARIDPQQVPLNFRVSADGASDVTAASAIIVARVRNLPGQPIRVTAQLVSLEGPSGPVPLTAVRWTGSPGIATGGGRQAICSRGTFSPGAPRDFVQNWQTPGTLTCSMHFELMDPRTLPAGLYSGVVKLALPGH